MPKQSKNKQFIINTTGQVVENQIEAKDGIQEVRNLKKKITQEYIELIHECEEDEKRLTDEYMPKKDKVVVRDNNYFYKLKKSKDNLCQIYNLSHSGRELLFLLMLNMDYRDNVVAIEGRYPSNDDLQKTFKMAKNTFQKALKELKENNIVHLQNKGKYRIITINPMYIEDSKSTESVWNKF